MPLAVSRIPCDVCYKPLAQILPDLGYGTHPCCDAHETPDRRYVRDPGDDA